MNLDTPIKEVARIGVTYSKKLKRLGIEKVEDLLYHFPYDYKDFSNIEKVKNLQPGLTTCVQGTITEITNNRTKRKNMMLTEALFQDDTGTIKVIWFNQPYLVDQLDGQRVSLAGKVKLGPEGPYLNNPIQEKLTTDSDLIHTNRLVPLYSTTKGVSSRWLRYVIYPLLQKITVNNDPLPEKIREEYQLIDLNTALHQIHFPNNQQEIEAARRRLAFEELFLIELSVLKSKFKKEKEPSFNISINEDKTKALVESLNFDLTDDQRRAAWEIIQDMNDDTPMARLLQGDVGSGKTIVAALAAFNVIQDDLQVAFMAPTTVLADQHYQTITDTFDDFNLQLGLLTNEKTRLNQKKISDRKLLTKLHQGKIDLLIGTHSLAKERVCFKKLGLVIIDEQHRFGTNQRAQLLEQPQKETPHLLSMTATPIPRSLALTLYGDLDLSTIKEMPAGRQPVKTVVVPPRKREDAYGFIKDQIKDGRQVFVVCPRIESEPENEAVKTVEEEYEKLSEEVFPDLKVAPLHGQMKNKEQEKIIKKFRDNKINILVSTSVIEVGVDIPNATVIMIEGADRFGLAQLHQLRGRVGRSDLDSYCLLFTENNNNKTIERLKAVVQTRNGFELAEKDLELRGPGDFFGNKQWGVPDLVMANLKNTTLVKKTRRAARNILNKDSSLSNYPKLKRRLKYWNEKTHLE